MRGRIMKEIELTILMPCLNEEKTLETCIKKAKTFLKNNNINGEILISDNGSTDNSVKIAKKLKARVVTVSEKGYGSALICGCENANGKYVIMGDSDDSYDFLHLELFMEKLREGYDLVMGNRFKGGIERGAMPFSHKYIGNPVLSFLGRILYKSKIGDFHCGLRGYNRKKILELNLECLGMEYASEMVVKAELNNYKIAEVPTTLKKDGRNCKPHLRTVHDGIRHLKFLLFNAPMWMFLIPGIILFLVGLIGYLGILFSKGSLNITSTFSIGIHSMLYFNCFMIFGIQLFVFYILDRLYSHNIGYLRKLDKITKSVSNIPQIYYVIISFIFIALGIVFGIISFTDWEKVAFGELVPEIIMPKVITSTLLFIIGNQILFSSILINIMSIKHKKTTNNVD